MTPRKPSDRLVVDTSILLAVAFGERSRPIYNMVRRSRALVTTVRARAEALGVAQDPRMQVRGSVQALLDLFDAVEFVPDSAYAHLLDEAAAVLRLAVPSRNGSTRDAHVLALAWAVDADVWSGDRDFAGTGWPSWSNANLARVLAPTA